MNLKSQQGCELREKGDLEAESVYWGVRSGSPELMVAQLKFTGSADINQMEGSRVQSLCAADSTVERRTGGREEQDPLQEWKESCEGSGEPVGVLGSRAHFAERWFSKMHTRKLLHLHSSQPPSRPFSEELLLF